MVSIQVISVFVPAIVAILVWQLNRMSALKEEKRKLRLELINKKINNFYGPLYVADMAGRASYNAFCNIINIDSDKSVEETPLSEDQTKILYRWMEVVFLKQNDLIEKTILENAYLIEEEELPSCLIDYLAHIATWREALKYYEATNDFKSAKTLPYPSDLSAYVRETYIALKNEQLKLIKLVK